jgi:hypothetical protein
VGLFGVEESAFALAPPDGVGIRRAEGAGAVVVTGGSTGP